MSASSSTSTDPEICIKILKRGLLLQECTIDKIHRPQFYSINYHETQLTKKRKWFGFSGKVIADLRMLNAVRTGLTSLAHVHNLRENRVNVGDADRAFSFTYGGGKWCKSFLARSNDDRDLCVSALRRIIEIKTLVIDPNAADGGEMNLKRWLESNFRAADLDENGKLGWSEVSRLLNQLGIELTGQNSSILSEYGFSDRRYEIDFETFVALITRFTEREDIAEIANNYALETKNQLNSKELQTFFAKALMEDVSLEQCENLIVQFEPNRELSASEHKITMKGLELLLMDKRYCLIDYDKVSEIYQDMDRPLCSYFINTSHNTYLLEDQIVGDICLEAYTRVLLMGCRCVELDVQDGYNGHPEIFHKKTLTQAFAVMLKDVLVAIKQDAFTKSKYPLILNIENSCGLQQQKEMAKTLKNVFGDSLAPVEWFRKDQLPSPNELINLVLIRSRAIPKGDKKIAPEFAAIVHLQTSSLEELDEEALSRKPYQTSSLDEFDAIILFKEDSFKLWDYASKFLLRVYPFGMRMRSENFYPYDYWRAGCQLVALNFQTAGTEMSTNHGFFMDNGRCGYVLKPETDNGVPVKLKIKLISGQHLIPIGLADKMNKAGNGVFVDILIHGNDEVQFCRSPVVTDNALNPRWKFSKTFKIQNSRLSAVHFFVGVNSFKTSIVSSTSVPVSLLRPGFRHVPMMDKYGQPIAKSSLFVWVKVEETKDLPTISQMIKQILPPSK